MTDVVRVKKTRIVQDRPGLKGKIRSISYGTRTKISIPGAYSSTEIDFRATVKLDEDDDPKVIREQLAEWVEEYAEQVSMERLRHWKEVLSRE